MSVQLYNSIGVEYSVRRGTDPKIAKQLQAALQGATRIINIGAGTGSYEPEGIDLLAVEPSSTMISQRKNGAHRVIKAFAENLPVENKSFSHAMAVLTMHHWDDRARSFEEINRVTTDQFIAITWDPTSDPFWLTRDYFPEIYEWDQQIFPGTEQLMEYFDEVKMTPLLIPYDCKDGFLAAYWQRPKAYLKSEVRQSISSFSKITNLSEGLNQLRRDLANGVWAKNCHEIMGLNFLDVGYKLISSKIRA